MNNLYVHFPFCRTKCSYCALHSRGGTSPEVRAAYVRRLVGAVRRLVLTDLDTVYFGGGSPALCNLEDVLDALAPSVGPNTEFTVELHPLDVTEELMRTLRSGSVNRISLGVESLDDDILRQMRRGYDFVTAERAFALVRHHFENAGIDLIVGYPGDDLALTDRHRRLADWGLRHCSVYSLIWEERSILSKWRDAGRLGTDPYGDDEIMDFLREMTAYLGGIGLERYEISNFAVSGFECRHNLAVWRGEDYVGLGEGAHGRIGRFRTCSHWGQSLSELRGLSPVESDGAETSVEAVSPELDACERRLFRLRTNEGLDAAGFPRWRAPLDRFVDEGLLTREGEVYFLTDRGREVCDTILAELV